MYKDKKYLLDNFKNLMIKSFNQDVKKIEFDSHIINIKEWGLMIGTNTENSKVNDIGGFDWLKDKLDFILLETEDAEALFDNYQYLYEDILEKMVLKKDISMFPEYFHKILTEFSKLPSSGVVSNNTLDEAYILHSRLIAPGIVKYYKKNIDDKNFAHSLLKMAIDLAHYILLTFPDRSLKKLPIKRPIQESESNMSLHDIGWQAQAFDDYFDVYKTLRNFGIKEEIQIMKDILTDLNMDHAISSEENSINLYDDENITLSIMESGNHGDIIRNLKDETDSEKISKFYSYLVLFKKMFYNNPEYCLETLLPEIHEIIANTKERESLDLMLFRFSQELIELYIINEFNSSILLENALKYSSYISLNTLRCYCGKYEETRYKGIVCDRCGVKVGELKASALDYIFKKLSGEEVFQWNQGDLKGAFIDFNLNNETSSIFIEYINKISDINKRRKMLFSLIMFTQQKEYTIRCELMQKFKACQSDSVDEYLDKSNLTLQQWADQNLSDVEYHRRSYYNSHIEEKSKSLNDESEWKEENLIENILFNSDPWSGEPNTELINSDENIKHEKYFYETSTELNYSDKYIYKLLNSNNEKLFSEGLKENKFLSEIGEFYCKLIENYKKNRNIKDMNLCIRDFMDSLDKNDDKTIIKFIKLALDIISPKDIIKTLNKIQNLNYIKGTTNFIIENTPINNSLLLSNLNQKLTLKNDFILLNEKFDEMNKKQIFKYLYQYSDNIIALESFLSHSSNFKS